jgi:hypothetical protein
VAITEADRAHLHQTVSQMCDLVVELRRLVGRPDATIESLINVVRRHARPDHRALAVALDVDDHAHAALQELRFDVADVLGLPTGQDSPAEVLAAVRALRERAR